MPEQTATGKELFTCSGCIGKWCETDTTICVPDASLFENGEARDATILSQLENQWIEQTDMPQKETTPSVERILITSEKFDLLTRLCEENDETIQECIERLIDKENFDRHYTYDGLSGKTYQRTCMSHKCMIKSKSQA